MIPTGLYKGNLRRKKSLKSEMALYNHISRVLAREALKIQEKGDHPMQGVEFQQDRLVKVAQQKLSRAFLESQDRPQGYLLFDKEMEKIMDDLEYRSLPSSHRLLIQGAYQGFSRLLAPGRI